MDLQEFLGVLRARWRFILAVVVVGTALTLGQVLTAAPQYSSGVKIFISTPSGGLNEQAAAFFAGQRVASYADLATEPGLLGRVAERAGVADTSDPLAGRITASVIEGTQTIQVDVRAGSPEEAQRIAEAEGEELVALVRQLERPADEDAEPAITARVVGQPTFSDAPVAPNVPLSIAVGLVLTLLVALTGGLLRHLLDRSVKSRREVEKLTDRAVLATLPFEGDVRRTPSLVGPGSPLGEAFRVLRTNLQFTSLDDESRMLLVASAVPGEGKTLASTNLAVSLAQSGQSVLLVDADMRNPNVADVLGLENAVGLVTVLVGRVSLEEALQPHESGVAFLATGPMPPNPAEVLATQAMRDLLAKARQDYDYVVIDAPPILPVADTSILLTQVDGALLIVRHGSTTREQVKLAATRIDAVGGRLVGTALNRTPRTWDGYGYGYGHGYGYGTAPEPEPAPKAGRARRKRRRSEAS